jgi:hypothetical protein
VDNTGAGVLSDETTTAPVVVITDCILYGNGTYGVNFAYAASGTDLAIVSNDYNAYGSNTSGPRNGLSAGAHDVSLSADPFTNKAAGDYSLNTTAGGGAACRAAGYPGAFQGALTTGYLDIGAAQSQAAGGSGGGLKLVGRGGLAG